MTVHPEHEIPLEEQCCLVVENISKKYKDVPVLHDVSLEARRGDVIAIMGPSGSGKSTLLRCINFLEIPDAGSVHVHGEYIRMQDLKHHHVSNAQLLRLRAKVAMVFQQFNLWTHMTVLENVITAPIHVLGKSKDEAIALAEKLLDKVGLLNKRNDYPLRLSGGQQQRVGIARALAMEPEVLLFDEPTSALDPELVGEVLAVMLALAKEGKTMLVATHELGFARDVATQALFLEHGKIIEKGAAKKMFANPQTERFKKFIEKMYH